MYKYTVVEQELYKKALKKLSKTYRNIDLDVKDFLKSINTKEDLGIELKSNIFKVRVANSDKNKGKSAGYRLISYFAVIENELHLLYIYDKSKLANVTEKEIDELVTKQIGDK
jgi:mRNA-degrading endonuclease RelE of RelBE toxin-antitoxin system